MNLQEYKALFLIVTGIIALLVASPALSRLLIFPRTEFFTEFWILDSNHTAEDYPFNITRNHNYSVFLGFGNYLGSCAYYLIEVKFRDQNQSAPDSFNRTPSSLPSLFNITAFVADEEIWEQPITLSFDYRYNEALLRIELQSLKLNDVTLNMRGYNLAWDADRSGFFGNLFFEAWIYRETTMHFEYHERFVGLWLNMTIY